MLSFYSPATSFLYYPLFALISGIAACNYPALAAVCIGIILCAAHIKNKYTHVYTIGLLCTALFGYCRYIHVTIHQEGFKHFSYATAFIQDKINLDGYPWKYRSAALIYEKKLKRPAPCCFYTTQNPFFLPGDLVTLKNLTIKSPTSDDFKTFLYKEGIIYTAFTKKLSGSVIERPRYSLKRGLYKIKKRVYKTLKEVLSPTCFTLVSTIFAGEKQPVKTNLEQIRIPFVCWGITHQLARSGLHLVVIILICRTLLNYIPLPFFLKHILCALFIGWYTLFTTLSVSYIRALLLFFLYLLCAFLEKPFLKMHLLLLTCFCVLLYNPLHLFFLDFQLSFLLTGALIILTHITHQQKVQA